MDDWELAIGVADSYLDCTDIKMDAQPTHEGGFTGRSPGIEIGFICYSNAAPASPSRVSASNGSSNGRGR